MYAVIETGGKQYRVEVGTELEVELLDVEPGQAITLDRVLLVADGDESSIGRPLVAEAAVSAEVLRQTRGEKLISFKYRPKARSRVKKGHRQELTVLRITDVRLGSKSAAEAAQRRRPRQSPSASASRKPPPSRPPRTPPSQPSSPRPPRPTRSQQVAHRPRSPRAPRRAPKAEAKDDTKPTAEASGAKEKPQKAAPKAGAKEDHPREEGRVTEMAHKKAGGSVKNGRDSVGQRLGVKAGDGQLVPAGSIIVRQRGQTFLAGTGHGPRPRLHGVRDDHRARTIRARDEEQEADPRDLGRRGRGHGAGVARRAASAAKKAAKAERATARRHRAPKRRASKPASELDRSGRGLEQTR